MVGSGTFTLSFEGPCPLLHAQVKRVMRRDSLIHIVGVLGVVACLELKTLAKTGKGSEADSLIAELREGDKLAIEVRRLIGGPWEKRFANNFGGGFAWRRLCC